MKTFGETIAGRLRELDMEHKTLIKKMSKHLSGRSLSPAMMTWITKYNEIPGFDVIMAISAVLKIEPETLLNLAKQARVEKISKNIDKKYAEVLNRHQGKK